MPNCEKKAGSSGPEVLHGITIVESDMLYCSTGTSVGGREALGGTGPGGGVAGVAG